MGNEPLVKGNICLNVDPQGCERNIHQKIGYVKGMPGIRGPRRALIIGSSTGFGLGARIVLAFGAGCATLGVSHARPPSGKKNGAAGWYNTQTLEREAMNEGIDSHSISGDAFSDEVKDQSCAFIREQWGGVDLVVYSVAAGRKRDPETGEEYRLSIKPTGESLDSRTLDIRDFCVRDIHVEAATEEEILQTVKVMGGQDWERWMMLLHKEGLLSENAVTVAFSYIGPDYTQAIYRAGTDMVSHRGR